MDIQINIKFYGILHNYYPDDNLLKIMVPAHLTIQALSQIIYNSLCQSRAYSEEKNKELIQVLKSSAFAKNDDLIEEEDLVLQSGDLIAILPPVCGG